MATDETDTQIPPSIERVLRQFRALSREDKMQALVQWSRKLEPVPQRFLDLDRAAFTIPECATRVDLFPEVTDGKLHFYADLNCRESPTIAAVLAILFSAVNDQPRALNDMPIIIKVVEHGPYLINNDDAAQVTVVDAAGNTLTSPKVGKGIALCRCGASLNKPFCDGAHKALPVGTLQLGLIDK